MVNTNKCAIFVFTKANNMATLKNAKLIKETEKAIQIEFWKKLFWIPKKLSKVNDDSIEIVDWFYKK